MATPLDALARLSERELLDHFKHLVRRDRRTTVELLVVIAEIDERKIWAKHACSSMFLFCMQRFHMSEQVTAKRLRAARVARRYPVVLEMVARGELHLSAVQRLSGHLTRENHLELLGCAKHKSSREVERLIAEIEPRPDVPSRIRALPRLRAPAERPVAQPNVGLPDLGHSNPTHSNAAQPATRLDPPRVDSIPLDPSQKPHVQADAAATHPATAASPDGPSAAASSPDLDNSRNTGERQSPCPPPSGSAPTPSRIVPLSPRRYKIEITVDQATHDKLRSLQDLLGRSPTGRDPAAILSRAIDVLLVEMLKRKAAQTDRPRPATTPDPAATTDGRRARGIPAAVRREVWRRDCGRCRYVDGSGRRCNETSNVEFHHRIPFARGGLHVPDNIELRCPAHNQYQADLDFGRSFMDDRRRLPADSDSEREAAGSAGTISGTRTAR